MNDLVETYAPAGVGSVELTETIPTIEPGLNSLNGPTEGPPTKTYHSVEVLVTLHKHPLGVVTIDTSKGPAAPEAVLQAISSSLTNQIRHHLSHNDAVKYQLTTNGILVEGALVDSNWRNAPCWSLPSDEAQLPKISIVVATSNRADELKRCVERLLQLDYPDFDIVIVDNGAEDNSTKVMYYENFREHSHVSYVSIIEPGVSHARNVGTQHATGEIVAFTDDDVIPDANWLRALARQYVIHPDVDCVTGLVLPASFDHQAQQWFEEYGGFNKGYKQRVFARRRRSDYTVLYPYTAGVFGSGNNASFRKERLIQLGGFDEDLGPGTITRAGEDLDAFLLVIMNKGKISYEPAAIIYHYHRDEYLALRKQLFNYGIGLSAIFMKWGLLSPRCAVEIAARLPLGAWLILNPKSSKNSRKSPQFPRELTIAELKGMVVGPLLYVLRKLGAR